METSVGSDDSGISVLWFRNQILAVHLQDCSPWQLRGWVGLPLLRLPENTRGQRRWLHPKSPDANMHISIAPHIQLKDKKHEGKMSHGVAVLLQLLSIYLQLFCVFQAVFFYFPSHEMTQTCNFSHLGSNHVPFSSDSHIYYFISS